MADPCRYDGRTADELRRLLDLPLVETYASTGSVMDAAHALGAEGVAGGALVLAEEQTAGRGRGGRTWRSAPGAGLWMALLERPRDAGTVELLSLRLGLAAARALDRHAPAPVRLKWPNDLYVGDGKLAGILIESRWRGGTLDWVVLGLGINLVAPAELPGAAALRPGTDRVELLAELVPALRAAAAAAGGLTAPELERYAERDLARGRRCREPARGVVRGIDERGALVIDTPAGETRARAGSLVLEEEP